MAYPVIPLGFLGGQGDSDIYKVERSLRFNSADSARLNRTFGTPTTQNTFTLSLWVKLGVLGTARHIFGVSTNHSFGFTTGNALNLTFGGTSALTTTALFRDPLSWYHIVWSQSGTSHTIYVNGVSVGTATATSSVFNSAVQHLIGASNTTTPANFFNGYMAEINFIDGQALTPSSFSQTDSITGRYRAIKYSGTYGNNGFYLSFLDSTSTTTLGYDDAGSNDWTLTNFSVAAGSGNDSLLDSPTNSGTSANYCTWNPLILGDTCANGNLDVTNDTARGTFKLLDFDAYWEITSSGGTTTAGIIADGGGTSTTTIATGKTYGFRISKAGALDYINITDAGAWVSISTGNAGLLFPYASAPTATTASLNAGQREFAGSIPAGYSRICSTSLPTPKIQKPSLHTDAVTYTGTGSAFSPTTSLLFTPDLVLVKSRGTSGDFSFYDSSRGVEKRLESNTDDEVTADGGVTAFNSGGFSVGTLAQVNTNTNTYVAWAWKKSALSGMDVVTYTGNGANRTISHGLGAVPKMILVKARTTAGADQGWVVFHSASSATPQNEYVRLDNTSSFATLNTVWANTAPTSSNFAVGTSALVNANNDTYVAYLFSEVDGLSRFSSYSGNGNADGAFIWCGFEPRIFLLRNTGSTFGWRIYDSARNTSNPTSTAFTFDTTGGDSSAVVLDFVSNGVKIRDTASSANSNTGTYIFAAFAESPFKYARAK